MKKETCPRCASERIVPGGIFGAMSGVRPFYFRPKGLKLVTLGRADAKVDGDFIACADCGMLWSGVEPKQVQEIVRDSGTTKLRARLGM